ncbi:MAG: hypothetical protein PVI90_03655 [Desulfobacteraceae bacterium]|jgi:hypothetical protein
MKHTLFIGVVIFFLLLGVIHSIHAAIPSPYIPPVLKPWQAWVLHDKQEMICPIHYNDGKKLLCQWPTRLKLDINHLEGKFEQNWLVFANGWMSLPGNEKLWPEDVMIDGVPAVIILQNNSPSVYLTPGEHYINGRFTWRQIPEVLPVPASLGLITLTVNGEKVPAPLIDDQGRLWLQKKNAEKSEEDALKVQVFRLLEDTIPFKVTTLLKLNISGRSREIELEEILIPDSIPMAIESPLPAHITDHKKLLLQGRAGRWEVRVTARMDGALNSINAGKCVYGDEIWSFRPHHDLRMVNIEEVPPIEPSQTEMPHQWRSYQAFLMQPQSTMLIKELRRGDPDPAPDRLSIQRSFWLDFNGTGFTVQDRIRGTLNRQWHLAVNSPTVLGRVNIAGQDRVITEQGADKKMGVELRKGDLDLVADTRIPFTSAAMSAVGWDHDFNSVKGTLHLPPGWRLLFVKGADYVSDSWLQQWSLLDFFLILIIALSIYKLRSWQWGLVALFTMTLIFHEPHAPRLVWLHILASSALFPLLPHGWFKRMTGLWGIGAMVILLAISIPFFIQQIRWGIYPQLAPKEMNGGNNYIDPMYGIDANRNAMEDAPLAEPVDRYASDSFESKSMPSRQSLSFTKSRVYTPPSIKMAGKNEDLSRLQDPDMAIPTGPGLPDWRWKIIQLKWNGPVTAAEVLKFYLLSPFFNLLLAIVRVGLLALLIWALIDWRVIERHFLRQRTTAGAVLLGILFSTAVQPGQSIADSGSFPSSQLLEELQQRLLEKPECLPHCSDITRMELSIQEDQLQILLQINSAGSMAVPLPINRKSWLVDQIILDYAPIKGLVREENGQMWALIPDGIHILTLTGSVRNREVVQIPLPLKPHLVSFNTKGWLVEGVDAEGFVGESVQLTRLKKQPQDNAATHHGEIPHFFKVNRKLSLGLTWETTTTITRLSPLGTSVVINVPLLADEAVNTAGVIVENGRAQINLAPNQQVLTYKADLRKSAQILLQAPTAVPWTETWELSAGPVWHCDFKGIPVIQHQDNNKHWRPRWQPWPGEEVSISIQRLKAVKAQTRTIDNIKLVVIPGARSGQNQLTLNIRTSRGGQHSIELPPKAVLQTVTVNDRALPVRQQGSVVTFPLEPGKQKIGLQWQQSDPFSNFYKVSPVKIEQKAVNAKVTIQLPDQRWVLLAGGPSWGPAVLFWSYLAAIGIAAFVLGKISFTPLKNWQWFLLGCGLTQVPVVAMLIIVGWLIVLGLRKQYPMPQNRLFFNTIQLGLIIWSLAALVVLFTAVKTGLVGMPQMQITGNNSSYRILHWTQDHIQMYLPQPWVFSLPVWIYRILMLVWSLWLAIALLKWLEWAWLCLSTDGFLHKVILPWPISKKKTAVEKKI